MLSWEYLSGVIYLKGKSFKEIVKLLPTVLKDYKISPPEDPKGLNKDKIKIFRKLGKIFGLDKYKMSFHDYSDTNRVLVRVAERDIFLSDDIFNAVENTHDVLNILEEQYDRELEWKRKNHFLFGYDLDNLDY